jgi:MOSC domain-containing protein YiiM
MARYATVVSVNVGRIALTPYGTRMRPSAIDKRPVDGQVAARRLGIDGDQHGDRRHHGGVDKAVYAYAYEDLRAWADMLDRSLKPGQFGENLTTLGLDVTGAVIGERWGIGEAVLEVSCPRIPCRTFAGFLGEPRWVRRFTAYGAPGAYLRVVEEGRLGRGDTVSVLDRPGHGLTVGEAFRALTGDHAGAARLLEAPQLPARAHEKARIWLGLVPAEIDAAPGAS